MEVYEIIITLTSFFNSQGAKRGNTISTIQNSEGRYYIPGSHIKGVIRCEAERIVLSLSMDMKLVYNMFGKENEENQEFFEPKLKFTDVYCENNVDTINKTGILISRSLLSNTEKALFDHVLLPPGTRFTGKIYVKRPLSDEEQKLLLGSVLSASHYGIGSSRSRGLGGCKIELKKIEKDVE